MVLLWTILFAAMLVSNAVAGGLLRGMGGADYTVESTRIAKSLLEKGAFSDPYGPAATGPTTHVGPPYPLIYAAMTWIFGTGTVFAWSIRILTLAAFALQWALLPLAASRLGLRAVTGLIAALLGVLLAVPFSLYNQDAAFTSLLLVILTCLIAPAANGGLRALHTIAAGLLWGVACLFNPIPLLVWFGWALILAVWMRGRASRRPLAFLGLTVLVITPWLARDALVFGGFVFIRGTLGTELAASNNDCASAWLGDNQKSGCFALNHPDESPELARRAAVLGEYRFNAEQLIRATAWIKSHPARFLVLSLERARAFWLPLNPTPNKFAVYDQLLVCLFTALSIPGAIVVYRENRFAALLFLSAMLLYSIPYFFFMDVFRYRLPIFWMSVLLTAFFVRKALFKPAELEAAKGESQHP